MSHRWEQQWTVCEDPACNCKMLAFDETISTGVIPSMKLKGLKVLKDLFCHFESLLFKDMKHKKGKGKAC